MSKFVIISELCLSNLIPASSLQPSIPVSWLTVDYFCWVMFLVQFILIEETHKSWPNHPVGFKVYSY